MTLCSRSIAVNYISFSQCCHDLDMTMMLRFGCRYAIRAENLPIRTILGQTYIRIKAANKQVFKFSKNININYLLKGKIEAYLPISFLSLLLTKCSIYSAGAPSPPFHSSPPHPRSLKKGQKRRILNGRCTIRMYARPPQPRHGEPQPTPTIITLKRRSLGGPRDR